jgi:hypothetical protein
VTLDELINELANLRKLPEVGGGAEIVLARDPEGNGFLPLTEIEEGAWDVFDREFGFNHLDDDLREQGFDIDDIVDGVPGVCLWPGYPRPQSGRAGVSPASGES